MNYRIKSGKKSLMGTLISAVLIGISANANALGVTMAGNYQNFDVLNDTGGPTYGFEMEVHGVSKSQLTRIFPSNFNAGVIRYGFGSATDFPGGIYVRWIAPWNAATGQFTTATPVPLSMSTVPGESCWTGGMPTTYLTAGCEHFGISSTVNPTNIIYRWLVADPNKPGAVIPASTNVSIPAPIWTAVPPADPAMPPVVVAEVQAPPPPVPALFGDAQWVKVYKVEHVAKIKAVDDLVGDNPAMVPKEAAEIEVEWSLIQQDPQDGGGNQRRRGKLANQGDLGNGNHSVVRRYEYYKYAGAYDPNTHEALCADLTCTSPSPGELGDAIGAQNAAANLNVNALSVKAIGGGSVASSDRVISCGTKCYGVYNPGTSVTLTANTKSGNIFQGWSGACSGNDVICTLTLNKETSVKATFAPIYKLVVKTNNPGTVTAVPAGIDQTINCGIDCTADFIRGTIVTLTAKPPAGKTFVNWSGSCSGAGPSCSITINAKKSVIANFSK